MQGGGQNGIAQEEVPVNEPVGETDNSTVSQTSDQVSEGDAPGQSGVGHSLSQEEAQVFITEMEANAEVAPEIELTIENWDSLFGEDGLVETPIGEVKMGENQFTKLMRQGRDGKLGMVKPTLENPDVIIEDESKAKNGETERPSSYVFVKSFKKADGSRYYYFTSVTVSKNGKEVIVSNQEKRRNAIANLLTNGKLVWKHADNVSNASDVANGLYSSQGNSSDLAAEGTDAPQTNVGVNEVYNRHTTAKQPTENVEVSQDAEREGGQSLILSPNDGSAAALSALPLGLSSASEDRNSVSNSQENAEKSGEIAENEGETNEEQRGKSKEESEIAPEIQEPRSVEEMLDNGDKRITNYNSRGEVATVAIERDGKVVSVDSYDEGVLFEHTEYDGNGKATSVTRYDKQGNVVGTQVYEDGKAKTPMQKLADRILDRTEEKRRIPLRERARELEAQVGVKANIIESLDEVKNREARKRIAAGEAVAGWYSGGQVYLYMPNIKDRREIELTYVHEVVAHHGVKKLLGERFNEFLDGVWNMMSEADRARMLAYVGANENPTLQDMRAAADEYVAELAEKMNLNELEQSTWEKIVDWFKELLENIGFENLTKEDIESMLKASYANLRSTEQGAQSKDAQPVAKQTKAEKYRKMREDLEGLGMFGEVALPKGYKWSDGKKYGGGRRTDASSITALVIGDDLYLRDNQKMGGIVPFVNLNNKNHQTAVIRNFRQWPSIGDFMTAVLDVGYQFDRVTEDAINEIFTQNGIGFNRSILRPMFRISRTSQEFDATQAEAVEKRGIVAPGLNEAVVNVIDVPRHDFTGNLKEARAKAKEWAIENYTGKEFDLPENAGKYVISKKAIGKYLDKSAFGKSENAAVHLSVLKELPNVISNSIEAEIHADYSKGDNGERSAENGVNRNDLLVHRIYGAVNIDGKTYRVKTTIYEFRDANTANTPHSYEVTKIELIEDSTVTPNDGINNPLNRSVNSISAAKLLEGVEKSYDKGKKVLDEGENSSENDATRKPMTKEEARRMVRELVVPFAKELREEQETRFRTTSTVDGKPFHENSYGLWKILPKSEWPQGEPDYVSRNREGGVSSQYWYGEDEGGEYIIRKSDHWSADISRDKEAGKFMSSLPYRLRTKAIRSVNWALDYRSSDFFNSKNKEYFEKEDGKTEKYGKIYLKDLQFEDGGTRFRIANENQDIFVSNAQRAVEGIQQNKATAEQWIAMLKKNGGLKAGEDAWLGLEEWLNEKQGAVTKQEILDFIGENKIQIEEVEYSENAIDIDNVFNEYEEIYDLKGEEEAHKVMIERYGENFFEAFKEIGGELRVQNDKLALQILKNEINSTRLNYTTEGLDNKREIALVVPTVESWNASDEIHFGDAGNGRAVAWVRFGETTVDTEETITAKKAVNDYLAEMREKHNTLEGEETDAMTAEEIERLQELTAKEIESGEKKARVLVIDEIQSKRHQEGREKGYRGVGLAKEVLAAEEEVRKTNRELTAYREPLKEKYNFKELGGSMFERLKNFDAMLFEEERTIMDALGKARNQAEKRLQELREQEKGIPSAPFEKNWHELAMKRMLRLAAEEGFDKVAWTTGEQQAQRYDMSKVVSHIACDKVGKNGNKSFSMGLDYKFIVDPNGIVVSSKDEYVGKSLADIVGKTLANKMLEMQEGDTISGDGLRIGGEGMKGFYDRMLPSFVQKYTKKWGAKVGEVTMPSLEENNTMWSVDVTPEMQESVMQGQTMFRMGSRVDARMAEVAAHFEGKQLTAEQQAVVDVFGGKADNLTISVKTKDGNERRVVMRQGNEMGAGAKHSLFRHFGMNNGAITADDILLIPEILANGERVEKKRGKKTVIEYKYTDNNGVEYTVITENNKGREEFANFYTNRKASSAARKTRSEEARDTADDASEDKGSDNSSNTQEGETRFRTVEEGTDGSIDDIQTQPLTLMERITNSLLEVSAKNKENLGLRADALRAFGRDINSLLSLMKAQREYDKSTVDTLVKLAKMYFKNAQLLGKVTPYEVARIMGVLNRSVGKRDISTEAARLMDILLDAHTNALAGILDKAEKVKAKKVNAAGVEVMGRLDKYGQKRVDEYRAAKEMTPEKLEEAIYDSDNRLAELEQRVREELGLPEGDVDQAARDYTGDNDVVNVYMDERARLEGLTLAREYKESIQQVQEEIKDLKRELKQAEEDYRLGNIDGKSLKEFRKSVAEAIMESKAELIEGYHSLIYKFQENTKESSKRAKAFAQAQIDRAREIQHNANSDMEGISAATQGTHPENYNNAVMNALRSPFPTLQGMMKKFGEKNVEGKGYLYERFIPQATKAGDNEFRGKVTARVMIEGKLKEIYGNEMSIAKFMK